MTAALIIIAFVAGGILGVLVAALAVQGASEDAYRRGSADERANALATALWHAEHDSYGGSDPDDTPIRMEASP